MSNGQIRNASKFRRALTKVCQISLSKKMEKLDRSLPKYLLQANACRHAKFHCAQPNDVHVTK